MGFESVKARNCEANKKVSYRQRGSLQTKRYTGKGGTLLEAVASAMSFAIKEGEVIESALFEKVVRDCRGNEIRKEPVRRFRKVGSDEWFTVPTDKAQDFWVNRFEDATSEAAIAQSKLNAEAAGSDSIDSAVMEKERIVEISKTEDIAPSEEPKSFIHRNKWILIGAAGVGLLMFGRKLIAK